LPGIADDGSGRDLVCIHHEGTKDTKGVWDTEGIQHGTTNKLLFLWLLFFVFFVSFVPSW